MCLWCLTCAVAVTSFLPCFRRYAAMFDSYLFIYVWQVESWHYLACLCPARWLTDMFWHVYTGMFMLPCLISVYLYMFDRCSPDMNSGQEMTSVQQKILLRVSMFWHVMVGITRSKVFFLFSGLEVGLFWTSFQGLSLAWWFRNPARKPVELGSFSHYLQGFIHPGGCLGFLPSTVA